MYVDGTTAKQSGIIMIGFLVLNMQMSYLFSHVEGTIVKQADAILIGFPLMYNMSKNVRANDLLIYEKVILLMMIMRVHLPTVS